MLTCRTSVTRTARCISCWIYRQQSPKNSNAITEIPSWLNRLKLRVNHDQRQSIKCYDKKGKQKSICSDFINYTHLHQLERFSEGVSNSWWSSTELRNFCFRTGPNCKTTFFHHFWLQPQRVVELSQNDRLRNFYTTGRLANSVWCCWQKYRAVKMKRIDNFKFLDVNVGCIFRPRGFWRIVS